jgi:pheromone shutdown protein TraB
MRILKYITIDFLSILSIYILNIIVYPHFGRASSYIEIAVVCFFVGLFFSHSVAHGVSISTEDILMLMGILFMIGRPLSAPLSDILKVGIIAPMLPFIPTGLIAGFVGGQIKKYTKKQR